MSIPSDLVPGTLDLLLLKILALVLLNKWAIREGLKQMSDDIVLSDGSPYPGSISVEWKASHNNRSAKFYSLTRLGKKPLDRDAANWTRLSKSYYTNASNRGGLIECD